MHRQAEKEAFPVSKNSKYRQGLESSKHTKDHRHIGKVAVPEVKLWGSKNLSSLPPKPLMKGQEELAQPSQRGRLVSHLGHLPVPANPWRKRSPLPQLCYTPPLASRPHLNWSVTKGTKRKTTTQERGGSGGTRVTVSPKQKSYKKGRTSGREQSIRNF
jgi:hypothetical protein